MGYYGRSMYRGDFYRGARGDFLSDFGTFAGKLGGVIDKGMQYIPAVGGIVTAYNTAFGKATSNAPAPAPAHPALSSPGLTTNLPALSPFPGVQMVAQPGYKGGTRVADNAHTVRGLMQEGRHRRMNPCNPHALRRAMRRSAAFMGFAKKYVKLIAPHKHVEMRHAPLKHHKKR